MPPLSVLGAGFGAFLTWTLARLAARTDARTRASGLRPARSWLPARLHTPVAARLSRADLDVTVEDAIRWWVVAAAGAGWIGLLVAPSLAAPAVIAVVVAGPTTLLLRAGQADLRARRELPARLDLVVATLRSGGTVPEALHQLAGRPGPLAADFRRIAARLDLGATIDDALGAWARERPLPEIRSVVGALALVVTVGGPPAGPLEGLAASLRDAEGAAAEARALSAQARMSAVVVGLAPLAYLVFASVTDPDSARPLVETAAGRVCLVVGLGLEVLAALWMRALLREPR